MNYIDCFNGDADGICALTQLRLAHPRQSTLVTGVKRDINLLGRVDAKADDVVTVLDVSLDKNRAGLKKTLAAGAAVFYCDHHFAGDIPEHDRLEAIINTTPDVCTSLLIDRYLDGAYREWAVVGTFGDNLKKSASGLARQLALAPAELDQLERLGIYLNYNGYGSELDDLLFHPADLYSRVSAHTTPQAFMHEDPDAYETLSEGYRGDMQKAAQIEPGYLRDHAAVFQLPDQPWARRVGGVFSNDLVHKYPDRAHAVLTKGKHGGFVVSLRAPLNNKQGADEVCRQFETGGGRAAAAGINNLPEADIPKFIDVFSRFYSV